ncbi:MAG: DUF2911 domain-containing protein [Verrucomicrobiota bacterium]
MAEAPKPAAPPAPVAEAPKPTPPPAPPAPKLEFPAASPGATLKQRAGLTDFEIVYSRPSIKGRTIFGGLVPYDQVWRTGANQSTKITFNTPVKFNDVEVPAGTYALYTIPGEAEWTIILYKNTALWGSFNYDPKDDVVRVKSTPVNLAESVETFTIEFNDLRDESATLGIMWDHTYVPVKVSWDLSSKLVPQIEAVMSSTDSRKPYYQAAMFYYDHGLDLQKAKEWIDAALKERQAHYMVYLQAEILAKLGDKQGAIAAAQHSKELAEKANDSGYVKLNEALISSLQAQ